jgi:hypothetical protein
LTGSKMKLKFSIDFKCAEKVTGYDYIMLKYSFKDIYSG